MDRTIKYLSRVLHNHVRAVRVTLLGLLYFIIFMSYFVVLLTFYKYVRYESYDVINKEI